jgi:regulator of replication initiation timing
VSTAAVVLPLIIGYGLGYGSTWKSRDKVEGFEHQVASLTGEVNELKGQGATATEKNKDLSASNKDLRARLKARSPLPSFVGKKRSKAESTGQAFHWIVSVVQVESHKAVGTILSQKPPPQTLMHLDATVTITVAKAFPPKLPKLLGETQADAGIVAMQHGWRMDVKKQESSEPVGTILSQTPSPGTYMRGSPPHFTIVVAKRLPAPCTAYNGNPFGFSFECGAYIYDPPISL